MGTFDKKLKMASKLWGKARERASTDSFGPELEDGRYLAALASGEITESKTSGRLQVAWTYVILEGESKGQTVRDYDGLETEDNQVWLARKLARLGFDVPEDLEEVEAVLEEINKRKPKVRIRVKTKGEYQNVYVDKIVTGEEETESDVEETTDSDTPETEEVEVEEETVEIKVGMEVTGTLPSGKTVEGIIHKVEEEEGKVIVRTPDKKLYRIDASQLSVEETEEDEVVEEDEVDEIPEEPKVAKKVPTKGKSKR